MLSLGHAPRRPAATAIAAAVMVVWQALSATSPTMARPAATPAAPAAPGAPTPAASPAPLTNEDIVRLVVHGTAEAVIAREIAARQPDFDLDPGVVAELEHVGVSRSIIEAMRRRQIDAGVRPVPGAAGTTASPTTDTADEGTVVVTFAPVPAGDPPAEIFAIATRPKNAPRPDDGEVGLVNDLALVLACTTSTHVPDHWDTRTPLTDAPRHEMLLFHPGSHHRNQHGFDLLVLDRDPPAPIRLAAGRHTLMAGLAGRHGSGAWRLIASDTETVDVAVGETVRLRLDARSALRGSRMTGYRVEQVFTLSPEPESPATDDPAAAAAPRPGERP